MVNVSPMNLLVCMPHHGVLATQGVGMARGIALVHFQWAPRARALPSTPWLVATSSSPSISPRGGASSSAVGTMTPTPQSLKTRGGGGVAYKDQTPTRSCITCCCCCCTSSATDTTQTKRYQQL